MLQPNPYKLAKERRLSSKKRLTPLDRKRERWFYLLISPWLLGLIPFTLGPIVAALAVSILDWPLPHSPSFAGISHFRTLLSDSLFWKTLRNTGYYSLGTVIPGIVIGLALALLVRRPYRGVGAFRAIFFLPVAVSGVALTLLWGWIFNPKYGLINGLLAEIGINGPGWFQDEHWAMPALILMNMWNVGINMLVYLAALRGVPDELHEAAALDGAGAWSQFWYITRPLVSPATFFLIIVNFIASFQVFTPSYILTRGGPNNATLTLPLYIYFNAFSWNKLGYASALSVVMFLVVLGLTIAQIRFGRRWVFYRQQ